MERQGSWELPAPEDPGGLGLPRPNRKLLLGLVVALLALVAFKLLHGSASSDAGAVTRSCTTPGVGVSGTPTAGGSFTFEITGPQTWTYLAWLDAKTATVGASDASTATPLTPGVTPTYVVQPLSLDDCTLSSTQPLGGNVAAGPHTFVVFRVQGSTATEVASTTFTVQAAAAQGSGR